MDNPPGEETVNLEEPLPNSLEKVWLGLVLVLAAALVLVGVVVAGVWVAGLLGLT